VWLPRARPEIFAFFADPLNLPRVNPPRVALRWVEPPPPVLTAGAVLDFTVRALLWRVRWRVLIREMDAPYRFVDAQILGPFRRWEHLHRFVEGSEHREPALALPGGGLSAGWAGGERGPGGTWVVDRVTYGLPLGPLGRLAHAVAVRRSITALFEARERRLRELFPPPG
jgi:ligand-binding SRPBCC domain-containing protein